MKPRRPLRDALGRPWPPPYGVTRRSEGWRLLLAALERTRARYVAVRCRVSLSAVYAWTAARNLPSAAARAELHRSYGIDPGAWDRPARRP